MSLERVLNLQMLALTAVNIRLKSQKSYSSLVIFFTNVGKVGTMDHGEVCNIMDLSHFRRIRGLILEVISLAHQLFPLASHLGFFD